jgi:Fe-S cluster assembly protein SufD
MDRAHKKAQARFDAVGMPGRRDEYWKYTRPDLLTTPDIAPAEILNLDESPMFDGIDRLKLVFVDGIFDADASDNPDLAGLEITPVADVAGDPDHWASGLYARLEENGQTPVSRPLAILNSATASQGVAIRATGKVAKPVNLVYLRNSELSDAMIHHVIRVEPGATLTVLENGPAAARLNSVMEVDVADTGEFHHVRASGRDHQRRAATHLFGRLGRESVFKTFTMSVNGLMARHEVVLDLTGNDAVAHVAGAAVGDGTFHHDDTVFITHNARNCESRQVFKKVLRNGAVGVFQGKILVNTIAQKTDGYQISQSLLLDDDSGFYAKPELEIYADDVICSHGSTTGAIDEEAMYYLQSRGVPKKAAQDMLVMAFLAQALDEIDDTAIADDILSRLEGWIERRHD